jgi:hypothetical protein
VKEGDRYLLVRDSEFAERLEEKDEDAEEIVWSLECEDRVVYCSGIQFSDDYGVATRQMLEREYAEALRILSRGDDGVSEKTAS